MAVAGVAKRYAQAAFEIAKAHNALEHWERDLQAFRSALQEDTLLEFFDNPAIPFEAKAQVLSELFPAEGEQRYIRNLITLLLERGRLHQLPDVVEAFHEFVLQERGVVRAEAITAVELAPEEIERLQQRLRQALGREVQLSVRVDPDVIGGIIIRIGDEVIDASVRTQLQALRRQLTGTAAA
ncbi:ATP synthase F1 subunit delta [Thermomicrobiaceae bacterium CFH 74404]|uniref:ATP synthase subunit delta n=1 Tax=Thermalbibacter longus TaxID=2951981 RepID=A0AA41WBZ2_9BACT|nr:ATP synthase F1 subunit delta [Thermalbibacter longus]MCM8750176.1 ATP synthase F1 subunit delta [Thermalbibacter longus]